jgi:hypothetical protein
MNPTVFMLKLAKLGITSESLSDGKPSHVNKSAATWSLDIWGNQ